MSTAGRSSHSGSYALWLLSRAVGGLDPDPAPGPAPAPVLDNPPPYTSATINNDPHLTDVPTYPSTSGASTSETTPVPTPSTNEEPIVRADYVYYRIFLDGIAIPASSQYWGALDGSLARIARSRIPPPRTVTILKRCAAQLEGFTADDVDECYLNDEDTPVPDTTKLELRQGDSGTTPEMPFLLFLRAGAQRSSATERSGVSNARPLPDDENQSREESLVQDDAGGSETSSSAEPTFAPTLPTQRTYRSVFEIEEPVMSSARPGRVASTAELPRGWISAKIDHEYTLGSGTVVEGGTPVYVDLSNLVLWKSTPWGTEPSTIPEGYIPNGQASGSRAIGAASGSGDRSGDRRAYQPRVGKEVSTHDGEYGCCFRGREHWQPLLGDQQREAPANPHLNASSSSNAAVSPYARSS
ncbi:hypothetical protein DL93DRAFT_2161446 [Clavulina sp. PMI_390]|nr:hypothetical protein DL93DRAFT_2161446 [Clavulina sp. PMI_390]